MYLFKLNIDFLQIKKRIRYENRIRFLREGNKKRSLI